MHYTHFNFTLKKLLRLNKPGSLNGFKEPDKSAYNKSPFKKQISVPRSHKNLILTVSRGGIIGLMMLGVLSGILDLVLGFLRFDSGFGGKFRRLPSTCLKAPVLKELFKVSLRYAENVSAETFSMKGGVYSKLLTTKRLSMALC